MLLASRRFVLKSSSWNTRNVFVQFGSHQSAHISQNGRMDEGPFAMVIIDSVTSLFRVDYIGRGELSVRQQNLGQMLSKLMLSKLWPNSSVCGGQWQRRACQNGMWAI